MRLDLLGRLAQKIQLVLEDDLEREVQYVTTMLLERKVQGTKQGKLIDGTLAAKADRRADEQLEVGSSLQRWL